ncbi:MAG: DUF167 domain-containing protein [Candidatus Binatia bacterium]
MGRRISVTVKPNSKSPSVIKLTESEFRAAMREPARDGKANRALIELLARHFGIAKSAIKIVRGHRSRHKIIELG